MKFYINFGMGTFHQSGCRHVGNVKHLTVDIVYAEARRFLSQPSCGASACSNCLPLLRYEAKGLVPADKWAKAAMVQSSYGWVSEDPLSQDEEIGLELGLVRLQERLRS